VIGEALTGIDAADERERARDLVRRRRVSLSHLPVETQIRRLVGLLARKGYPSGVAYQVVRDEMAEVPYARAALDSGAVLDSAQMD
jgi:regulatory protein